jgi:hypothetical protein
MDRTTIEALEFRGTTTMLVALAEMASGIDLSEYLTTISRDHALGPVVDPTAYRSRMGAVRILEDLAQAALEFQRASRTFIERRKEFQASCPD